MKPAALAYLAALQEIQNAILHLEAGNISAEQAADDVNKTAVHIPRLDREWRKEVKEG